MKTIDAHLHIWDLDAAEYPWLTADAGPLYRSFALDETQSARRRQGVDRAVLVQAADNDADTGHLLAAAARHPDEIAGVVAWAPLDDPVGATERIEGWRESDAPVVGVRSLIHERPDPDWIVSPAVQGGLAAVAAAGLTWDHVTSSPEALRHVPVIATRHPGLTIVIDHLAKPPIGGDREAFDRWRELLAAAADRPNVNAKVSGLYTPDEPASGTRGVPLVAFVDAALELFGPDRLLIGSDWPIAELFGGYEAAWATLIDTIAPLDASARASILGGTAQRVYGLR